MMNILNNNIKMDNFEIKYGTSFSTVCRTCLRVKPNMKSLYEDCIANMLMFCTSLQIYHDDGMPSLICLQCLNQVNSSNAFKQLCEKSDATLKQYILDGYIPTEDTIQSIIISTEVEIADAQCTPKFIHSDLQLNPYTENDPLLLVTQQYANLSGHLSEDEDTRGFTNCLELGLEPECNIVENALAALQEDLNRGDILCLQPTVEIIDETKQSKKKLQKTASTTQTITQSGERKNILCKECSKSFISYSDLSIHMSVHTTNGSNQCSVCKKQFTNLRSLKRHVNTHLSFKAHKCDICSREFTESGALKKHIKRHLDLPKTHICKTCGKAYFESTQLTDHIRTHTGEKPFICEICSKAFSSRQFLASHMHTHTQNKTHQCIVCAKRFLHPSTLTSHLRIHTGEKPYKCNICEKKFIQSSHLSIHMRTHNPTKPFVCSICSKAFARSSTLIAHSLIHTEIKPHQCPVCGKSFKRRSDRAIHMRIHTGERPYPCSICPKRFITASHRIMHMTLHNKKNVPKSKANKTKENKKSKKEKDIITTPTIVKRRASEKVKNILENYSENKS